MLAQLKTWQLKTWLAIRADRRGVTALEYALIAALIAVAIVGALRTLGTDLNTTFTTIASNL